MTGRCVNCGFLAFRAKMYGQYRFRGHSGYHEVEQPVRDNPRAAEQFIPGEANAVQDGEFGCFRGATSLPAEIADLAAANGIKPEDAARKVLQHNRACPLWTEYRPGLDPRMHYQELSALALEQDRRNFYQQMSALERQQSARDELQNRKLARLALRVTLIIGAIQLVAAIAGLTSESLGYPLVSRVREWVGWDCARVKLTDIDVL